MNHIRTYLASAAPAILTPPLSAMGFGLNQSRTSAILGKWFQAQLATFVQLFGKIIGVDTNFRQILPHPQQGFCITLEGLHTGANETGETARTLTVNA